ncbi:MAG: hypothetical protein PHN88_09735 [Ignavibacteria bacterium]|nr:hypothetical protein [Ignavibacteria bacterium]
MKGLYKIFLKYFVLFLMLALSLASLSFFKLIAKLSRPFIYGDF